MVRLSRTLAVAAAVTALFGAPAFAETVKVALIDMSAMMPAAVGNGVGMMGPGMMGPGMMGMMAPGMGRGAYAPGMMGMGMMSVRIDKTSGKAGQVTFDVTNWSRSIVHEMLVVVVDSPDAPLPYDYTKQTVIEEQVKRLGETDELQPNASKSINMTLSSGSYLLICNVPGHYAAGMVIPFTVSP